MPATISDSVVSLYKSRKKVSDKLAALRMLFVQGPNTADSVSSSIMSVVVCEYVVSGGSMTATFYCPRTSIREEETVWSARTLALVVDGVLNPMSSCGFRESIMTIIDSADVDLYDVTVLPYA